MKNIGKKFKTDTPFYDNMDDYLMSSKFKSIIQKYFLLYYTRDLSRLENLKDNMFKVYLDEYYNKIILPKVIKIRENLNKLK
jgi:hypothetical protein